VALNVSIDPLDLEFLYSSGLAQADQKLPLVTCQVPISSSQLPDKFSWFLSADRHGNTGADRISLDAASPQLQGKVVAYLGCLVDQHGYRGIQVRNDEIGFSITVQVSYAEPSSKQLPLKVVTRLFPPVNVDATGIPQVLGLHLEGGSLVAVVIHVTVSDHQVRVPVQLGVKELGAESKQVETRFP
tara:strand:- start:15 stop:572 length:558 start_codon:yes stop_codon:yes gene_type:complete